MISAPNLLQLSNGSKLLLFVFLLLTACKTMEKGQQPKSGNKNENEHLDPIKGKKKYNPVTGQYEYDTKITTTMDTIVWTAASSGVPPIGDYPTTTSNDPIFHEVAPSHNVAVILPFFTNKFSSYDSDIYAKSLSALQFYEGMKLALDTLEAEGIQLNLSILDSRASEQQVKSLLRNEEVKNADLLIGPFRTKTARIVADFAKNNEKIHVSPLGRHTNITTENPYFIQVNPNLKNHCSAIVSYIETHYKNKKIVVVATKNSNELNAVKYLQEARQISRGIVTDTFQTIIVSDESELMENDLKNNVSPFDTSIFIVPSWSKETFVHSFLRKLDIVKNQNEVIVFGMPQWMGFEKIGFDYYDRLNVHVSSECYLDPLSEKINRFKKNFYFKYGIVPTKQAVIGYDIMLYFGRLIHKYGKNIPYVIEQEAQQYLHTKFDFERILNQVSSDPEQEIDRIDYFQNKYLNILKFEDYYFQLAD